MSIGNILKAMGGFAMRAIGSGAAGVLPAVGTMVLGPVWTVLITNVVSAVMSAEEPTETGEAKKSTAMKILAASAGGLIKLIETTQGKDLVDDALFLSALGKITDGVVDMMNAFRMLPTKEDSAITKTVAVKKEK